MFARLRGFKALIIGVFIVAFLLALLFIALNIFLILIPVVLIIGLLAYLFHKLTRPKRKELKAFVDVKYKVVK